MSVKRINQILYLLDTLLTELRTLNNSAAREVDSGACSAPTDKGTQPYLKVGRKITLDPKPSTGGPRTL